MGSYRSLSWNSEYVPPLFSARLLDLSAAIRRGFDWPNMSRGDSMHVVEVKVQGQLMTLWF